jgi:prephenate dehydrogenase
MSSPLPHSVAIYGPGLLGGSILLALRERHPTVRRIAWARRAEALVPLRDGIADLATTDPQAAAESADLVILCTPIGSMAGIFQAILPVLRPETLVTDVGSVKGPVETALAPLAAGRCQWLGSHPMAGSDKSGLAHARADLFQDATTILTPSPSTPEATIARLTAFWSALGCRILQISPEDHDRHVAAVSHLPHLLAAVLLNAIPPEATACAGPGFRDVTRIAGGPPSMWTEILLQNRQAVLAAMDAFEAEAATTRQALARGDAATLEALLDKACQSRRSLV